MRNSIWCIFIFPSNKKGTVNRFFFHTRLIYLTFILVILWLIVTFYGIIILKENIRLKAQRNTLITQLRNSQGILKEIDLLSEEERIIKGFLGIEDEIGQITGQGGIDPKETFIQTPYPYLSSSLSEDISLTQKVYYLSKEFNRLVSVLKEMEKKLNHRPTIMPVGSNQIWISSGFGWRKNPFTGLREFHRGIDISGRRGLPIIAPADGVVVKVGHNMLIGKYIKLRHDQRFTTLYGHLLAWKVKRGQKVKRGEVIGLMGTSGMSTGYHLHYEVIENGQAVNPYNFIINRREFNLSARW